MDDRGSQALRQPTRVFSAGRGTAELYEVGTVPIARLTYSPGWHWYDDWREAMGAGERCLRRHAGVVLSGHLHLELGDGSKMDLRAGDAYDIAPDHDGWVIGDEAFIALDTEAWRLFS